MPADLKPVLGRHVLESSVRDDPFLLGGSLDLCQRIQPRTESLPQVLDRRWSQADERQREPPRDPAGAAHGSAVLASACHCHPLLILSTPDPARSPRPSIANIFCRFGFLHSLTPPRLLQRDQQDDAVRALSTTIPPRAP